MTPLKVHNTIALLVDLHGEALSEKEAEQRQKDQLIVMLTKRLHALEAVVGVAARVVKVAEGAEMGHDLATAVHALEDAMRGIPAPPATGGVK